MRNFALGAVVGVAALALLLYAYLRLGFLDFRADTRPSHLETAQAMAFLDASVDRRAPDRPAFRPTDQQLVEGMELYKENCAGCHGSPERPTRPVSSPSFDPPAPQFMRHAPDMSVNENFYIIQHGIRWTGMPAWRTTLSTQQIWEVSAFIGQMDKLPPVANQQWQAEPAKDVMPGMKMKREK
jgi:thiosulfate dehydrogenase